MDEEDKEEEVMENRDRRAQGNKNQQIYKRDQKKRRKRRKRENGTGTDSDGERKRREKKTDRKKTTRLV